MNINVYGECYICSLENAPLSPCNCKNMFIHEKCQIKSIRRLKNLNCTVCKGEYTNIKVRTIKRTRFTRISKIIIGFVICGVFLMTLGFIHIFFHLSFVFILSKFFSKICIALGFFDSQSQSILS